MAWIGVSAKVSEGGGLAGTSGVRRDFPGPRDEAQFVLIVLMRGIGGLLGPGISPRCRKTAMPAMPCLSSLDRGRTKVC